MITKYMSGQQALDNNLITETEWQQAISHPWTWVILTDWLKVREIPWNGLEVEIAGGIQDDRANTAN